jgi:hypothetical protein
VVVAADAVEERAEELIRPRSTASTTAVATTPTCCDSLWVDIEALRPPGSRQADVGWGPTTPAIPLRTVAWPARN